MAQFRVFLVENLGRGVSLVESSLSGCGYSDVEARCQVSKAEFDQTLSGVHVSGMMICRGQGQFKGSCAEEAHDGDGPTAKDPIHLG